MSSLLLCRNVRIDENDLEKSGALVSPHPNYARLLRAFRESEERERRSARISLAISVASLVIAGSSVGLLWKIGRRRR